MSQTRLVCLFVGIIVLGTVFFPSSARAVGVSPTTINFGSVTENTASTTTLVVTNNSRFGATLNSVLSSLPQFAISGPALPLYLPAHASASFQVAFRPNSVATLSGSVTIATSQKVTQTATVSVSGTGVAPALAQTYVLSLSTGGLGFGNQAVGTTGSLPFTVTNKGTGSVSISQVTAAGPGFGISGFSGAATLASGQSLQLAVNFTPTATGSVSGRVSMVSTATNSPATFPVSGTGTASTQTYLLSLSTGSLDFGNQAVGTTGSLPFIVTNKGTGSVSISQVTAAGPGFSVSGFSGAATLASGQSLSLAVKFAPTATGSVSGSVSVISTATNSPTTIPVSGTGTPSTQNYQLSFNPTAIAFGNQQVYSSSSLPFTLTNTGTGSVSISQVTITGAGFSISGFSGAATLAAGQSLPLTAKFAPNAAGSVTGSVSAVSTATNSPATIPVSGTAVKPMISVNPSSVAFGSVAMGVTNTQTITVLNPGSGTLNITQASLSPAGFNLSGLILPLSVAPGGSASFNIGFTPTSAGSLSGSLTLTNNATNPALSIPLSGSGVASALQLSANPTSLSFGSLTTGTSASQTVTLTNAGNSSVSISQVSASGAGFSVKGIALPLSLATGQSTTFSVTFSPASTGSLSGSVTLVSSATNSPMAISLSGTGVQSQISVIPSSVSFGNVTVGVTNSQTITIKNPGTATLSVTQASLSGTGITSSGLTLPLSVPPGGSSSFNLAFAPPSAAIYSGSITFISNTTNSPLVVPFSGTGTATTLQLSASPASLSYGSLSTGTSASQTVTLTNTGNSSVSISQVSESGVGFSVNGIALPLSLAVGQSTSFTATFTPASAGSLSGSVTVVSNATNSPLMIALSGTGATTVSHTVSLSWTPGAPTFSGFNVYRGTSSGGPYTRVDTSMVPSTSYIDVGVSSGKTYYYVATEVDTTGTESSYSSEVSAVIP
jgi:hypothetical protein